MRLRNLCSDFYSLRRISSSLLLKGIWPLKSQVSCLLSLMGLSKVLPVSLSLGNTNCYPILRVKGAPREINNSCRIPSCVCALNLLYQDFVPSRLSCWKDYPLPSNIYFSSGFPCFPQWDHWLTAGHSITAGSWNPPHPPGGICTKKKQTECKQTSKEGTKSESCGYWGCEDTQEGGNLRQSCDQCAKWKL